MWKKEKKTLKLERKCAIVPVKGGAWPRERRSTEGQLGAGKLGVPGGKGRRQEENEGYALVKVVSTNCLNFLPFWILLMEIFLQCKDTNRWQFLKNLCQPLRPKPISSSTLISAPQPVSIWCAVCWKCLKCPNSQAAFILCLFSVWRQDERNHTGRNQGGEAFLITSSLCLYQTSKTQIWIGYLFGNKKLHWKKNGFGDSI